MASDDMKRAGQFSIRCSSFDTGGGALLLMLVFSLFMQVVLLAVVLFFVLMQMAVLFSFPAGSGALYWSILKLQRIRVNDLRWENT